ncbi:hypothetical protein MKW98_002190 [Papaver atlanticum]|uniref:Uncharacterized protein n=1 Tax=Papaver atlanticum TaxID=357466 RepID=A0AAD4RV13_9MAGN|nr:hypothetical protein MKW98_002190 [Papaver atlanticum]
MLKRRLLIRKLNCSNRRFLGRKLEHQHYEHLELNNNYTTFTNFMAMGVSPQSGRIQIEFAKPFLDLSYSV